ncbi:MAG: hypothetical protein A2007_05905 [Verrucomicrobia bacterium GWC2_42_7]|nr:MAG: hypothetical protein A2007_05905 [Verrucomicrobia bacterium GWC2_42_7]
MKKQIYYITLTYVVFGLLGLRIACAGKDGLTAEQPFGLKAPVLRPQGKCVIKDDFVLDLPIEKSSQFEIQGEELALELKEELTLHPIEGLCSWGFSLKQSFSPKENILKLTSLTNLHTLNLICDDEGLLMSIGKPRQLIAFLDDNDLLEVLIQVLQEHPSLKKLNILAPAKVFEVVKGHNALFQIERSVNPKVTVNVLCQPDVYLFGMEDLSL